MKPHALIVFDMDGVIVDVSRSYRETVRQAARRFFTGAAGWDDLPTPLFSLAELAAVKTTGGLNNDWDLTCEVIRLLCRRVRINQSLAATDDPWKYYRNIVSAWDVTPLADFLKSFDRPLTRLLNEKTAMDDTLLINDFITCVYRDDVGTGNIIKQIFQEIYLGAALFSQTYGFPPVLHKDNGLNSLETLIIDENFIKQMTQRNLLAIATGRPRTEAFAPLNFYGLKPCFTHVVTLDDCVTAERELGATEGRKRSLSKPDPFMLDIISEKIDPLPEQRYYVGDMPDDMIAAMRARKEFTGIGFTASAPDKTTLEKTLREAGATHVFDTTEALISFLTSKHNN